MKIALIRHGKTVGNLYHAYVGKLEQPLCTEGRNEVLERKHKAFYPVVDSVCASPMLRCKQTAQLIYPDQTPIFIPDLAERDFGRFEGLSHKDIVNLPGYQNWGSTEENMEFPGGESWEAFSARALKGFQEAVIQGAKRKAASIAVVCHGGTIMAVLEHFTTEAGSRYNWACPPGGGYIVKLNLAKKSVSIVRRIIT